MFKCLIITLGGGGGGRTSNVYDSNISKRVNNNIKAIPKVKKNHEPILVCMLRFLEY